MTELQTRVAAAYGLVAVAYDLAAANRSHVIEIRTAHTAYRIMLNGSVRITADWIIGVAMTSDKPGRQSSANTRIFRRVRLGERHPYGSEGELSVVRSVHVGGVKVLG